MLRHLFVYLWMIGLYVVTDVTAVNDFLPVPPELLEVRNILVHSTAYAVLGFLIAWALSQDEPLRFDARMWKVLLGAVVVMGIGQEILQAGLRHRTYPVNSVFDVFVDTSGAAIGLLIYKYTHRRAALQDAPGGSEAAS